MNHFLQWFRDLGNGQQASDHFGATEVMNGSWPVAHLEIQAGDPTNLWQRLYDTFGVNATTCDHTRSNRKGGVSW